MKRILIVDDDSDDRFILTEILNKKNFIIAEAEKGEVAFELLKTLKFDLIILDYQFKNNSKFDGHQVLEHLKTEYPQIPVIMLTGFGTIPRSVEAMKKGATDYIEKDFDRDDFKTEWRNKVNDILQKQIENADNQTIEIPTMLDIRRQKITEIRYIEINPDNNRHSIVCTTIAIHSTENLKYFVDKLPENQFIKINQTQLINKNYINGYSPFNRGYNVTLLNVQNEFIVSEKLKTKFKEKLVEI